MCNVIVHEDPNSADAAPVSELIYCFDRPVFFDLKREEQCFAFDDGTLRRRGGSLEATVRRAGRAYFRMYCFACILNADCVIVLKPNNNTAYQSKVEPLPR